MIQARLIAMAAFVALIVGAVAYAMHIGSKYEQCRALTIKQKQDIETQVENERRLVRALRKQTEASEAAERAAETANALYEEIISRPRPSRVVTRDKIVEVVRAGDCDRAALDGWDLLKEKGVIRWESSSSRDVDYWREYYLQQARAAVPPKPVQVVFHVSQPLSRNHMPLRCQPFGLSSSPYRTLNSGLQISAEMQLPRMDLR